MTKKRTSKTLLKTLRTKKKKQLRTKKPTRVRMIRKRIRAILAKSRMVRGCTKRMWFSSVTIATMPRKETHCTVAQTRHWLSSSCPSPDTTIQLLLCSPTSCWITSPSTTRAIPCWILRSSTFWIALSIRIQRRLRTPTTKRAKSRYSRPRNRFTNHRSKTWPSTAKSILNWIQNLYQLKRNSFTSNF